MHSLNDNDISAMIYKSSGEMAEWSIAAVLKTVEVRASGGSNPSLSAINPENQGVIKNTHGITHTYSVFRAYFLISLTTYNRVCCRFLLDFLPCLYFFR